MIKQFVQVILLVAAVVALAVGFDHWRDKRIENDRVKTLRTELEALAHYAVAITPLVPGDWKFLDDPKLPYFQKGWQFCPNVDADLVSYMTYTMVDLEVFNQGDRVYIEPFQKRRTHGYMTTPVAWTSDMVNGHPKRRGQNGYIWISESFPGTLILMGETFPVNNRPPVGIWVRAIQKEVYDAFMASSGHGFYFKP